MVVLVTALRLPLDTLIGERAPYAFVFLGVVVSCVLAGWRSGLLTLVLGQVITWFLFVEPRATILGSDALRFAGLLFATVAQLLILAVVTLYQREVAKTMAEQGRQMDLLTEALREIDHRTKNNYQTVVALILLQAQRATQSEVRAALAEAADRVRAVSLASDQLALRSKDLGTVRLGDHLQELCQQIKRGLAGDEVLLRCDFDDITARADTAIHLSIIVNELVTNALKHAFNGKGGEIHVRCKPAGEGIELVIADNGRGMKPGAGGARSGLGTRLVQRFVEELAAKHEVNSTNSGTTHKILLETIG